jgi:hypothetical protein
MWSRQFLIAGLASGAAIAVLTLGGIWLFIFALDESFANIMLPAVVGTVVYPLCWRSVIHRSRDYSWQSTAGLVLTTYIWCCVVVAATFFALAVYQLILGGRLEPKDPATAAMPVLAIILALIGALLLAIPFAVVGTPMAFLHRAIMLRLFATEAEKAA